MQDAEETLYSLSGFVVPAGGARGNNQAATTSQQHSVTLGKTRSLFLFVWQVLGFCHTPQKGPALCSSHSTRGPTLHLYLAQ